MSSSDDYNRQLNEKKASLSTLFSFLRSEIKDTVNVSETQRGILLTQRDALETQKGELESRHAELKKSERTYNKSFQDKKFHQQEAHGTSDVVTLQDFAFAIYAVGWFLFAAAIVAVSVYQPGGSWTRGSVVAALMTIITIVVYGLMKMYI